jgi:CheY-like chemotaxis protein/two-component sensor histidine kinase
VEIVKHAGNDRQMLDAARDTLERQFGQMVRLVDDLLDVGRITRDKLELRTQRVELASIIHQAVEICRPLAEAAGHRLDVNVPAPAISVEGDPLRLAQVFSNLLNNACKFTEPGGEIRIATRQDGAQVEITVADSGIGIAPDQLGNIFEMFSQVDSSLERTHSGLGIGLTLVKRLVEMHGGTIVAASDGPGRGSIFTVRLPVRASEPALASSSSASSSAIASPKRILVTDDNRDAANTVAMLLRLGGHEVTTAYDGLEAVEQAEKHKPDVMLLDIGLPGMNGYDVCRAIRQQAWGKPIRIIALTGWGQDQDRQNAREAGFDDHLVKPVDPETLCQKII